MFRFAVQPGDQVGHLGAVKPHDPENRAELDENLERLRALAGEADGVADDDQMAGGGHRQKFRQALDHAENQRLQQQEIHGSALVEAQGLAEHASRG